MVGSQLKLKVLSISLYYCLSKYRWVPHLLPLLFLALDLHFSFKNIPVGVSGAFQIQITNFYFVDVLQPPFYTWRMAGISKALLIIWLVKERRDVFSLRLWNSVSSHLACKLCTLYLSLSFILTPNHYELSFLFLKVTKISSSFPFPLAVPGLLALVSFQSISLPPPLGHSSSSLAKIIVAVPWLTA